MSRKLFVAGNWKMNTNLAEGTALAEGLKAAIGSQDSVDVAVCPPFVYAPSIVKVLKGSKIEVGVQNMYYENNGAFTGEISGAMIRDIGCRYVILGHSERRHVLGETDQMINRKIVKALADGLDVIFCIGELLEEREADQTMEVITRQVKVGLEGVPAKLDNGQCLSERLTVAYEPVWAIGTGKTASPAQAQEVHAATRKLLAGIYSEDLAQSIRIQYGGSVKPSNAAELLGQEDVDGALVGGASLKVEDFSGIVKAVLG
jgi:triosephosphate isomerase